jgi:DNA-directed RNA polymerase II subunit RPB1
MCAEYIENQKLPLVKYDNKAMDKNFKIFKDTADRDEKKYVLSQYLYEGTIETIEENGGLEEMTNLLKEEYGQLMEDRKNLREFIFPDGENSIALPVNVPRLLWNSREEFELNIKGKVDLDPAYVIKKTKALLTLFNDEGRDAITVY